MRVGAIAQSNLSRTNFTHGVSRRYQVGEEMPVGDLGRRHLEHVRKLRGVDGNFQSLQRDFDEPRSYEFMVGRLRRWRYT